MPHLQLSKNKLLTVRKMNIYYKGFNKHFLRLVVGGTENEHYFSVSSCMDQQILIKWFV